LPIIVPPFSQYQAPLFPLRGLWNHRPPEGDRFITGEIDWGLTVKLGNAVQFQLSGNSPLAFSQIAAFSVDNTRNASDCTFLFPDSGYTLVVPAFCQGTFPVFTNALQFYVASTGAVSGDRTVFQALNSIPPPVAVQESAIQENNGVVGITLGASATVPIVAPGINGTLELVTGSINGVGAAGSVQIELHDGNTPAKTLWVTAAVAGANKPDSYFTTGPMRVGFVNGINIVIVQTGGFTGVLFLNVYYGVP
jgi:hypothetical protein